MLLERSVRQNTYFYNVLFPLFFHTIKAFILEYQSAKAARIPGSKAAVKAAAS